MEEEVRERHKFGFFAKAKFEKWKVEKAEIEVRLE